MKTELFVRSHFSISKWRFSNADLIYQSSLRNIASQGCSKSCTSRAPWVEHRLPRAASPQVGTNEGAETKKPRATGVYLGLSRFLLFRSGSFNHSHHPLAISWFGAPELKTNPSISLRCYNDQHVSPRECWYHTDPQGRECNLLGKGSIWSSKWRGIMEYLWHLQRPWRIWDSTIVSWHVHHQLCRPDNIGTHHDVI